MSTKIEDAEAEKRLAIISATLERAAADLSKLVEEMRKVLEENALDNRNGKK